MDAQIISIGTEILLGNIIDTNSQFIAQRLMEHGINVYKMETVGDNVNRLYETLKACDGKVDYVISSGGLGPTPDDISKEVAIRVCDLEEEVEIHDQSYQWLIDYFNGNEQSAKHNIKQAKFPKSAIILKNSKGTAPGCILESKLGTKYVLLPGPPNEMKAMFDDELSKNLSTEKIIKSRVAQVGILGEWDMARRLDLDRTNPTISPYVKTDGPVLRITASGNDKKEVEAELNRGSDIVRNALGPYLITFDDIKKEEVLIDLLRDKKQILATAESITGGLIASSIIDIAGASDVIKESYVVYSNEAKEKLLGVSRETIKEYTVVSEQVLEQMLDGLYEKTKADLCIGSTGYAHTGNVYLGILYKGKKYIVHKQFNGDRNRVRYRSKNLVVDMAILILRGEYENIIGV